MTSTMSFPVIPEPNRSAFPDCVGRLDRLAGCELDASVIREIQAAFQPSTPGRTIPDLAARTGLAIEVVRRVILDPPYSGVS